MNVFSRIYQANEWNGVETRSGPGSHREPTRRVSDAIVELVDWLDIASVLDVGCGESNWMPDLPGYVGIDPAPEAIAASRQRFPDREFYISDPWLRGWRLFDLVISRDVMQHLSLSEGAVLLEFAHMADPNFLLASTYIDGDNINIETGDAYRPNLEAEPFNLPPALLLIHDGYEYHDGDRLRDPAKMLGLWRL